MKGGSAGERYAAIGPSKTNSPSQELKERAAEAEFVRMLLCEPTGFLA